VTVTGPTSGRPTRLRPLRSRWARRACTGPPGYEAMTILADERVLKTAGFPSS
jgi:hypothetical protein